jgi:hypothetical protein
MSSSQSSPSVNFSVSWEAVSESDILESIQFCNTCFDFLARCGIESPTWSSLGSKILKIFFLRCQSQNSWFPCTHPPSLLILGAALGYGWNCCEVAFFSEELPTYDDVKPLDCAVRTEGSLLLPHTADATLKSLSLKTFLESGHMPEFLNPAILYAFFMKLKLNVQKWLYLWGDGYSFYFSGLAIIQSFCATVYFALKCYVTTTSKDCRWCVQCGGKMTRNILLKWGK